MRLMADATFCLSGRKTTYLTYKRNNHQEPFNNHRKHMKRYSHPFDVQCDGGTTNRIAREIYIPKTTLVFYPNSSTGHTQGPQRNEQGRHTVIYLLPSYIHLANMAESYRRFHIYPSQQKIP